MSIPANLFLSGISLLDLIAAAIGLIVLWIVVSIPVYLAGKIVTGGRSTLGEAMIATVLGPVVYFIVFFGVKYFLNGVIGGAASTLGYVLAFLAWIWVYKFTFRTGWLRGLAIAILAVVVFVVAGIIVAAILSIIAPSVSIGSPLWSLRVFAAFPV